MAQVVGKVISVRGEVLRDGLEVVLAAGDEILADDTLLNTDPQASIKIQYSHLDNATTYAGVFNVLVEDNELDLENVNEEYLETAAGEDGAESNNGVGEDSGIVANNSLLGLSQTASTTPINFNKNGLIFAFKR
ncbi:MAG: hypothetical protein Q9M43_06615 [Sulfurimonas sp.]|nr:hypothetical protein [Sulfurimonas sp.]